MRRLISLFFCLSFAQFSWSQEEPVITLTPLIESVSIDVKGQTRDASNSVQFREGSSGDWQPASGLYFDSVGQSLSGVIVGLSPATEYEVRIEVQSEAGLRTQLHSFTTRPDKPPIDPEKVYLLSDIYEGGTLDLEALGISGSEDGWAMIKGDRDTPVMAGEGEKSAVWIGSQSYIYFEDVVIKKGGQLGFFAEEAHHLWFNGCDVSDWGRTPAEYRNGIAYDEQGRQINYDSAFFLRRSGVITVENCYVHDPEFGANHWGYGHPKGTNAFIAFTNYPDPEYQGQIILRNNTFTGTDRVRFNDVVESRFNLAADGGFVRDSAIYNNKFAYANDDLIEIDGGQHNVLVYNNDFSHGYGGISVAPNRHGPSFVFNNTIHKMGDERGLMWAALKAGGVNSNPEGQVNFFNNYVDSDGNGITASYVQGDDAFWINAVNNVLLTKKNSDVLGYGIWDNQRDPRSAFVNNFSFNLTSAEERDNADITVPFYDSALLTAEVAEAMTNQPAPKTLVVPEEQIVPNLSARVNNALVVGKKSSDVGAPYIHPRLLPASVDFNEANITGFSSQNKDNDFRASESELVLRGNTWLGMTGEYVVGADTVLDVTLYGEHQSEIAGIGFDDNNRLSQSDVLMFYGSQSYGTLVPGYKAGDYQREFSLPVGEYFSHKTYSQMLFVLDNDKKPQGATPEVSFSNLFFYQALNFNHYEVQTYDVTQDDAENSTVDISANGLTLTITGNAWKRISGEFSVTPATVLIAHVKIEESVEIAGIGLDTNTIHSEASLLTFGGSQMYGNEVGNINAADGWQRLVIPLGEYFAPGVYQNLTFVLDNDVRPQSGAVHFRHVALVENN